MKVILNGVELSPVIKNTEEGRVETFANIDTTKLANDYSKLLVWDKEDYYCIWMKETPIKLFIIFVNNKNIVTDVIEGVPNNTQCLYPSEPVNKVLEIRPELGLNVKPGDILQMAEKKQEGGIIIKLTAGTEPTMNYNISSELLEEVKKLLTNPKLEKQETTVTIQSEEGKITSSPEGKHLSTELEEKKIFDYLGRAEIPGVTHTLDGYSLDENNFLVENKSDSVKGKLITLTEKFEELAETQVGKNLWTYGIKTEAAKEAEVEKKQEGGVVTETAMTILDEKGKPQMELEGGERIFSIKDTKYLIKLAQKAKASKADSDYIKLAEAALLMIKNQDEREPEFTTI